MAAKDGLAAGCLSHRGMDSSFAGLGAARGWHWSGRFITSACATMLIVAAGGAFSGSETPRQKLSSLTQSLWGTAATAATAAAAADALDRATGMIKKAVYRSSGRRVRGEDDKIPYIKTVAPDLPLDVFRNMDIRFDSWSACTPLCSANALRMFAARKHTCTPAATSAQAPRTRQSEWRARQMERCSE